MSSFDCHLRDLDITDLERVLSWRNHPDIRRYMYNEHLITLEEHISWFESATQDDNRHLLIFEVSGKPSGFVNINIIKPGIAHWGFYLAPDSKKGTGSQLGKAALDYAFYSLELNKVCGEALSFNVKSIKFHRRLGFLQEGIMRQQHYDGQNYCDIHCFGILSSEWRSKR